MSHPLRIQRKRTKGYRMPQGSIYVGRPTKWGNPWPNVSTFRVYMRLAFNGEIDPDIKYNELLERIKVIARDIEQLRGKQIACWCPLGKECHADVLAEYANR